MIYLALHNSFQAGAALAVNSKIVGAITEERITRKKDHHTFPHLSIEKLLSVAGIHLKEVDKIIYGMVTDVMPSSSVLEKLLDEVIQLSKKSDDLGIKAKERILSECQWNKKHLDELLFWAHSNNISDKLVFVDHHMSHASGAYFHSPYENALIFTCDGKGNFKSSSIFSGVRSKIEELEFNTTFKSIGYFYGNITKSLGYRAERHEGKITGLAAYGDPSFFEEVTDQILSIKDGNLVLNCGDYYLPWFVEEKDLPILYQATKKHKPEDVAAAAQKTLEITICSWIFNAIRKYRGNETTNVCLSGGVFANVKLNQKINELSNVKSLFIQPAMGDMGIPLGSLLHELSKDKGFKKVPQKTMSLGSTIELPKEKEISLNEKYKFKKIRDFSNEVCDLIEQNTVIGYIQGRAEYGPRALCNRSIIYHCRDKSINKWLNSRLNRTEFMPFAPVTTLEIAERVFLGFNAENTAADFMTITYTVSEEFSKKCPAAVHVDNTARPQIVRKEVNPQLHELISTYCERTGDLGLINTSLNNHEEPIIDSLSDALKTLDDGNVDLLVLNDTIITLKS